MVDGLHPSTNGALKCSPVIWSRPSPPRLSILAFFPWCIFWVGPRLMLYITRHVYSGKIFPSIFCVNKTLNVFSRYNAHIITFTYYDIYIWWKKKKLASQMKIRHGLGLVGLPRHCVFRVSRVCGDKLIRAYDRHKVWTFFFLLPRQTLQLFARPRKCTIGIIA